MVGGVGEEAFVQRQPQHTHHSPSFTIQAKAHDQPGTGGESLQGKARRRRSYETKKVTEIKSISMHGVQKLAARFSFRFLCF